MKGLFRLMLAVCFLPQIGFAQYTWEHTSGPPGSAASSIRAGDHYAFIPEHDFLYRTSDGIHWEKIEHQVSVVFDIYRDTIVNIIRPSIQSGYKLQISPDNGITWIVKSLPLSFGTPDRIAMCQNGIYLSERNKNQILRSVDHGTSWDTLLVSFPMRNMKVYDNRLYVFGNRNFSRLEENGIDFQIINHPQLPYEYIHDIVVRKTNIIFASENYLFDSQDGGISWDTTLVPRSPYLNKLALVDTLVYAWEKKYILRSDDNGIQWDTLTDQFNDEFWEITGFKNMFLAPTTYGGSQRWDEETQSMVVNNNGLDKGFTVDMALGKTKIWAKCTNGIFSYDLLTDKWDEKAFRPDPFLQTHNLSANDLGWVLVMDLLSPHFFFSEDEGVSWDSIPYPEGHGALVKRMQIIDDVIYLLSYLNFYRSTDKGVSWDIIDLGFVFSDVVKFRGKHCMGSNDSLFCSGDRGATWHGEPLPFYNCELYSFSDLLYATGNDINGDCELFISDDGIHWTIAHEGLPDEIRPPIDEGGQQSLFFRDAGNHYAFLQAQGHFVTSEQTISWTPVPVIFGGHDYVYANHTVYKGTHGVYKSIIENPFITAVDDITESSNATFTISPNPANDLMTITPDATFKFRSPIRVLSSDGKLMKSINTSTEATQIDINISDLPDGIYFVSLQGENGRAVNSFVKVR